MSAANPSLAQFMRVAGESPVAPELTLLLRPVGNLDALIVNWQARNEIVGGRSSRLKRTLLFPVSRRPQLGTSLMAGSVGRIAQPARVARRHLEPRKWFLHLELLRRVV